MTSTPAPGISELPDELGGVVLALALATPAQIADVDNVENVEDLEAWRLAAAARVAGRAGELCRAALAELAAQPRSERAQTLSRLVKRVTAPVPAGLARVHPSWLRAALEGEATDILAAVTQGLPEAVREVAREVLAARGPGRDQSQEQPAEVRDPDPASAGEHRPDAALDELRRAMFGELVAMPDPAVARPEWQRLAGLPLSDLLAAIARDGAETLGISLAGAPPPVLARAAAQAGGTWGEVVLAAARRQVAPADRVRAREVVALAASLTADGALVPTQAVGLVALAHRLAGELPSAVRAVAQRLPLALGQVLVEGHPGSLDPGDPA